MNPVAAAAENLPLIAVVIVNYRTPMLTLKAVESIDRERPAGVDLVAVIIDNASGDSSADVIAAGLAQSRFGDRTSFLPQTINGGFGWGNNQAVLYLGQQTRKPDFVLFLNPDAEVQAGAVQRLYESLRSHAKCGVVGASLIDDEGRVGHFGFRVPTIASEFIRASRLSRLGRLLKIGSGPIKDAAEVDWVTGAAFMARWAALAEAGLFDDGYFLYFEEVELMSRIRAAGWAVRYEPAAQVLHREGSATGVDWDQGVLPPYWHRSRRRYFVQALGLSGADRADHAYRVGRVLARLRGRWTADAEENVRRMGQAAALPLAPKGIAKIGQTPGTPPAWIGQP